MDCTANKINENFDFDLVSAKSCLDEVSEI